jgi:hypothetical protein
VAACALFALLGCGRDESPEERVRATIAAAEEAAEARDVADAMDLVADEYRDARFDRAELARFVHGYFVLNPSIRMIVRVDDVEFPADDLALARVTLGMLNTRSESEAWDLAAEIHEFDVELVRDSGKWLLRRAERRTSQ